MKFDFTIMEFNAALAEPQSRIDYITAMKRNGFSLDGTTHRKRKTNRIVRNLIKKQRDWEQIEQLLKGSPNN